MSDPVSRLRSGGLPGSDGIAPGARVDTPLGEVPAEALRAGDAVLIAGGGMRAIVAVDRVVLRPQDVAWRARLAPMMIRAGALGPSRPRRDVLVAPDQEVLIEGALVPVRLLANLVSIAGVAGGEALPYVLIVLAEAGEGEGLPCLLVEGQPMRAAELLDAAWRGTDPRVIGPGAGLARLSVEVDRRSGLPVGPLRGTVGALTAGGIVGWARDRADPLTPVTLELAIDGAVVATVVADRPRADIRQLTGIAEAGFALEIPPQGEGRRLHEVVIRRAGDVAELFATMALFARPEVAPEATWAADPAGRAVLAARLLARIDALRAFPAG